MPLQINIFLLLFGALQAVLFSIFLTAKKKRSTEFTFLIIYIGVIILQIAFKVLSKMWLMQNVVISYFLSYQLPFLYGPLVYLFTRRIYYGAKFKAIDMLHFAPFITIVSFFAFAEPGHFPARFFLLFLDMDARLVLQLFSILVYHGLAFRICKKHERSVENFYSSIPPVRTAWVKQFVLVSSFLTLATAWLLHFLYASFPTMQEMRFGFLVLTIFIYWITYCAIHQPDIFHIISVQKKTIEAQNEEPAISPLKALLTPVKYQGSGLSSDEALRITHALNRCMTEKLYLQTDLTIQSLAAHICCSRHHLSQVLNQDFNMSFYEFVNHQRVEEAKRLLLDEEHQHHKIAAIAYDAGFNSLSTFNEVFRKFTGSTPSEFRRTASDESRKQRI